MAGTSQHVGRPGLGRCLDSACDPIPLQSLIHPPLFITAPFYPSFPIKRIGLGHFHQIQPYLHLSLTPMQAYLLWWIFVGPPVCGSFQSKPWWFLSTMWSLEEDALFHSSYNTLLNTTKSEWWPLFKLYPKSANSYDLQVTAESNKSARTSQLRWIDTFSFGQQFPLPYVVFLGNTNRL